MDSSEAATRKIEDVAYTFIQSASFLLTFIHLLLIYIMLLKCLAIFIP